MYSTLTIKVPAGSSVGVDIEEGAGGWQIREEVVTSSGGFHFGGGRVCRDDIPQGLELQIIFTSLQNVDCSGFRGV